MYVLRWLRMHNKSVSIQVHASLAAAGFVSYTHKPFLFNSVKKKEDAILSNMTDAHWQAIVDAHTDADVACATVLIDKAARWAAGATSVDVRDESKSRQQPYAALIGSIATGDIVLPVDSFYEQYDDNPDDSNKLKKWEYLLDNTFLPVREELMTGKITNYETTATVTHYYEDSLSLAKQFQRGYCYEFASTFVQYGG